MKTIFLVCIIIFLLLFETMQPMKAYAQDFKDQANNEINTAEYKIEEVSSTLSTYSKNITTDAVTAGSEDISIALQQLRYARSDFQAGAYNDSLREACMALFFAGRCEYRVYLNMTNSKIEEANETISNVPWYLGKPWYAIDILQNATAISDQYIADYLTYQPYDENVSTLAEIVQYIVFTRIENQVIPNLFSNPQSAYNLASKSENLTAAYVDEQTNIFWTFLSIGIGAIIGVFLIGLVLGILGGPRIRRRFSAWRLSMRRTFVPSESMSKRERSFSLAIVQASAVIVTALFTLGALTGAVMQQVRFVYQFIGYMFAYALPFILSAVSGICGLYADKRTKRFPDLFDFTVTFFISGWLSFSFLLGLAMEYESLPQNLYYIIPFSSMIVTFAIAFALSLIIVYAVRRVYRKFPTKYLSLSSLEEK